MMPHVAIVVLNWNGWRDTLECLESLYYIDYPSYEVIVVDNGSTDSSVKKIVEYCSGKIKVESKFFKYNSSNKPIYILYYTRKEAEEGGNFRKEKYFSKLPPNRKLILILNEKNFGFAEGNNVAIRYILNTSRADYILLINNDTIVDKNFLLNMVSVAESDEKIGIVGPVIYYYDYAGKSNVISFAGGRVNMWKGKSYHIGSGNVDNCQRSLPKLVDYIEGSCMLIKKEVVNKIGYLDPSYFVYWEETDFCVRASKVGYLVVHTPASKIWHKISSSTDNISKVYYLTRNKFWFMKKHSSKLQLILFFMYFIAFQFWISSFFIINKKSLSRYISFCRGLIDGLFLNIYR